jgi:hypothetical protein
MRILFFLLITCSVELANAQLPSDPLFTKEDTLRFIRAHQPGLGFRLITQKDGTLSFSPYITARYLNSTGLKDSFTDAFGREKYIKKRNDLQLQKVSLYFKGWLFNPRFRYLTYVWTTNTA